VVAVIAQGQGWKNTSQGLAEGRLLLGCTWKHLENSASKTNATQHSPAQGLEHPAELCSQCPRTSLQTFGMQIAALLIQQGWG